MESGATLNKKITFIMRLLVENIGVRQLADDLFQCAVIKKISLLE
jgi:hypothetical protein